MPMRIIASQGRQVNQRGNTLLEASAVALLLFGLMFLLIDLALALFTKATLQSAVREGVRFAVTERLASGQSYLNDSVVQVVQQNSLGLLSGASGACKIVVSYTNPVTGAASGGVGGDVVEVSVVGYNYQPIGILKSGSPIGITASSSDVMENCPLLGCPPATDPNPPSCN